MQTQAIIEAALAVQESGIEVNPEIMVPLVGFSKNLSYRLKSSMKQPRRLFAAKGKSKVPRRYHD